MPWTCAVCALKNVDDDSKFCDLCNSPVGAPDPSHGLSPSSRIKSKRKSLAGILQAHDSHKTEPEQFDAKRAEETRLDALRQQPVAPSVPPAFSAPPQQQQRSPAAPAAAVPHGVFGTALSSPCPVLVCDCMAYIAAHGIKTEGIFRIPGDTDTVNVLKARYEKDERSNVLASMRLDIHDVGTLFKLYFRMLPEPLLPTSHYDRLMDSVRAEGSREDVVDGVLQVVRDIPSPQRECLGMIINFLRVVTAHEQVNKMTPANLATCFAPSLLRAPESTDAQQAFMDMSAAIGALNILIRHPDPLPCPSPEEVAKNTMYIAPPSASTLSPANSTTKPPPGMLERTPSHRAPPPGMMERPPGFD